MLPNVRPLTFHDGARIEWCGWRQSTNQDIVLGWWRAQTPDGQEVISSTLGRVYPAPVSRDRVFGPFDVFDLSVDSEERDHDHREPSEASRQRALARLRLWLDTTKAVAS